MTTGIQPPELKSISVLLTGDLRYTVPRYQRSFAWGSDEVEDFWDDLLESTARDSEYFLGTIVVQNKSAGLYEIIDGQQRLTCISMVFSAIRNAFLTLNDHGRSEQLFTSFLGSKGFRKGATSTPKLELNDKNNDDYVEFVVNGKSLHEVQQKLKQEKKTIAQSNKLLLDAYAFFLEAIGNKMTELGPTGDDRFLVPLLECVSKAVKLIVIPVQSDEDANLFFETLNARGKELAVSDLVKNRLYIEADDSISKAQKLWQKMEGELGRSPIPEFLRHYWIAKKASGLVREKELYRHIARETKQGKHQTINLLDDFAKTAADYAKITDYELWDDDNAYDSQFRDTLEELKLFRVSQCYPILLNVIQHLKKPTEIAAGFRAVANFSFRYFVIGNQSPGNLERASSRIAEELRTGQLKRAKDISEALKAISPDATFRADFTLASMAKSKAKLARYTLLRINNHLTRQEDESADELITNSDAKAVNLEHVLPQSPGNQWTKYFKTGIDAADYVYTE